MHREDASLDDPPTTASASAEQLLAQVARLCALSQLPQTVAVRIFQAAYASAADSLGSRNSEAADAFSAAQILTEWFQNPEFLNGDGEPAPLSVSGPGFTYLCASACEGISADRMLEILQHAGAVEISDDCVRARRRELIIGDTHPAAVARATRLAAEFISTVTHNLTRNVSEPSRFERTVVSTKFSARNVPSLLAYLSEHGQAFLEDLDSWMSARETDTNESEVGVGVYLYVRRHD